MTAQEFNAIRKACRMSYRDLATVFGCSVGTIRAYSTGTRSVTAPSRAKILALQSVTPSLDTVNAQVTEAWQSFMTT